MTSAHALKMADISKGKRSIGRRSSILKRVLADIDVNAKEKKETVTRRTSKRVSFAETYVVKEFPRDSPQSLKGKQDEEEAEDAATCDLLPDTQPVNLKEPCADFDTNTDSFVFEEGETTFISGVFIEGGFPRESTRIVDQNMVIEAPPHQMANWEPVGTEVLGVSMTVNENCAFTPPQPQLQPRRELRVAASIGFPHSPNAAASVTQNRTKIFGDQEECSMDLTNVYMSGLEMDTSAVMEGPPKIAARDFLSNMLGSGKQVTGMAQVTEEHTILFNSMDQGNTMELTGLQELPQNCIVTHTTTSTTSAKCSAGSFWSVEAAATEGDKTVVFATSDAACNMNLTQNLLLVDDSMCDDSMVQNQSVVEETRLVQQPAKTLMSAKAFLASWKGLGSGLGRSPSVATSFATTSLTTTTITSQPEDIDISMELTGIRENTQQLLQDAGSSFITGTSRTVSSADVSASGRKPLSVITTLAGSADITSSIGKPFPVGSTQASSVGNQVSSERDTMPQQLCPVSSKPVTGLALTTHVPPSGTGAASSFQPATPKITLSVQAQKSASLPVSSAKKFPSMKRNMNVPTQKFGTVASTMRVDDVQKPVTLLCDALHKYEDTVRFSSEDTAAAMDITEPTPDAPAPEGRTVGFSSEEIAAAMDFTQMTVQHSKSSALEMSVLGARTLIFSSEETAAGMDLTQITAHQTQLTAALSVPEDRTVRFSSDEAAADMDLTQMTAHQTQPTAALSVPEDRTVRFSSDDTQAEMEITKATDAPLNQAVKAQSTPEERTIRFSPEDTQAVIEITDASLTVSGEAIAVQSEDKTRLFSAEETHAAMEVTQISDVTAYTSASHPCGNVNDVSVTQPVIVQAASIANKEGMVIFKQQAACRETLIDLPLKTSDWPAPNKTMCFSGEETAALMNITESSCHNSTEQPVKKHFSPARKSMAKLSPKGKPESYSSEPASVAENTSDVSLGTDCVTETAIGSRKKIIFSEDQQDVDFAPSTASLPSDHTDINVKVQSKERMQDFPSDEIEAQMTMTFPAMVVSEEAGENLGERTALMEITGVLEKLRFQLGMNSDGTITTAATSVLGTCAKQAVAGTAGSTCATTSVTVSQTVSVQQESSKSQAVSIPPMKAVLPFSHFSMLDSLPSMKHLSTVRPLVTTAKTPIAIRHSQPVDSNKRRLQSIGTFKHSAKLLKLSSQTDSTSSTDTQRSSVLGAVSSSLVRTDSQQSDEKSSLSSCEVLNQMGSSGGSTVNASEDIFGETMPALPGESINPLSTSVNRNLTNSLISFGHSFAERKSESNVPPSCLEKFLLDMDIEPFEMKVWRRSSEVFKPDIDFVTAEDKLNAATVLRCKCEVKTHALQSLAELLKEKQAMAPELESMAMKQVATVMNTKSKVDGEALLFSVSVRGLLSASQKQVQSARKNHKADVLRTYARKLGEKHMKICEEMGEMTSSTEAVAAMTEKLTHCIDKAREQLEHIRIVAHKKHAKHHSCKQLLQQKQAELTTLREKITCAESAQQTLKQQVSKLKREEERAKARQTAAIETYKQLGQTHDRLHILHSLLSWRPVKMEDNRVELLMLYDWVLMTITLQGASSPEQPLLSLTAVNRLQAGSQPWAHLATGLVIDGLSAVRGQLLHTFPCRQQLPQLLDEVSRLVEDAKSLCQELKSASLRYLLTITANRVVAKLFSVQMLRKVVLTVEIPVNHYPTHALDWHSCIVMGDISDDQVHTSISRVGAGHNHFTRVLNAVYSLVSS